jgi:hypothetical protein
MYCKKSRDKAGKSEYNRCVNDGMTKNFFGKWKKSIAIMAVL